MSHLPIGLTLLAPLFALALTSPQNPSVDCAKPSGDVETLVCKDAELSTLASRMADVYEAAIAKWPDSEAARQRAAQRGWLKNRDECAKSADVRACVLLEYRTRIAELQIHSGLLAAPPSTGWVCTGGPARPFTTAFYEGTDPKSAVLTFGDDQVIAFVAASASGARYTAKMVEFWEHQGEAAVNWFGTMLTCRPLPEGAAPPVTESPVAMLLRTPWKLAAFQPKDGTPIAADRPVSLTFQADGRLIVQADCNRGLGTWRADRSSLTLGPVALTRMACPAPASTSTERFVRDLGIMRSFTIIDGNLHIGLQADAGTYRFTPIR